MTSRSNARPGPAAGREDAGAPSPAAGGLPLADRFLARGGVTLAATLLVITAARLPLAVATGNDLNHVSGAWMVLADDLAHGTLYRPLVSEVGTGGTRFFPAQVALHGALVAYGADPVRSGQLLAILSGGAVFVALAVFGRRLGLRGPARLTFAALPLAGTATQFGLGAARGDLLPVALAVFAFAALAGGLRAGALVAAAALLGLAVAAKPTAATALAAAVAWLLLRRAWREAAALAALAAGFAAALLGAAEIASGGRFSEIFAVCATAGATPATLIAAPGRLVRILLHQDGGGLLLLGGAAVALAAAVRARSAPSLPALWLGASVASALAILATPGTEANHLIELEAASAAVLAGCASRPGAVARLARVGAVAALVSGLALAGAFVARDSAEDRLDGVRRALAAAPRGGPILSEDPLIPLLAGERPFVADAFMFRVAAERHAELVRFLATRVRAGEFPAAVLLRDPFAPDADGWYSTVHFGPVVIAALQERYEVAARTGRYVVLAPRRRR